MVANTEIEKNMYFETLKENCDSLNTFRYNG